MTEYNDAKEKELVIKIRELAAELGATQDYLDNAGDAVNYDYQVQLGMAYAAGEMMDYDPGKLTKWFGHCIINIGIEPDARIEALLDALRNELIDQAEARDAKDGDEKDTDEEWKK